MLHVARALRLTLQQRSPLPAVPWSHVVATAAAPPAGASRIHSWRTYTTKINGNVDEPATPKRQTAAGTGGHPPRPSEGPSSSAFPPLPPTASSASGGAKGKVVKGSDGVAASVEERLKAAAQGTLPGGPQIIEDPIALPRQSDAVSPPSSGSRTASTSAPPPAEGVRHLSRDLPAQTSSSSFASQMLDIASGEAASHPEDEGPTGAKSKMGRRSMSSIEKRRQLMSRIMMGFIIISGGAWVWDQGREWESERDKRVLGRGEDGNRYTRARARIVDIFDYFNKPPWEPLIPPPLPDPHGRPYTLLVDLDDLLVHSSWTREHGWRTAKRPGVDYFLGYLAQLYEIVIFTSQPSYTAKPICEKLDPYGIYSPYRLFRECCRSRGLMKPQLTKDLNYLGRDLSKVVWLDAKPELYSEHPDNGFAMRPWKGNRNDTGLIEMIPLLEAIAFNQVRDVRDVVRAYKGRDPVAAYAESEARQKNELLEKWEEKRKNQKVPSVNIGSLFGISSVRGDEPPKLLVERDRDRAQAAYVEEQKYWKDNEATLAKLMEEDRERQIMEGKGSLIDAISGFMQPPRPPGQQEKGPSDP